MFKWPTMGWRFLWPRRRSHGRETANQGCSNQQQSDTTKSASPPLPAVPSSTPHAGGSHTARVPVPPSPPSVSSSIAQAGALLPAVTPVATPEQHEDPAKKCLRNASNESQEAAANQNVSDDTDPDRVGDLVIGITTTAFQAAKKLSEGFPPLKAAMECIGILVELADTYQDSKKALVALEQTIHRVTHLMQTGPAGAAETTRQKKLLSTMSGVNRDVSRLKKRGILERTLAAKDISSIIKAYFQKIDQELRYYELSLLQAQMDSIEKVYKMSAERKLDGDVDRLNKLFLPQDAQLRGGYDRPQCHNGTRVAILNELKKWANDPCAEQVCWLNGCAGSGKSTIAQSLAEWLSNPQTDSVSNLGASFFCYRGSPGRKDLTKIIPSIARQLANGTATDYLNIRYREELLAVLRRNENIVTTTDITVQLANLLVAPAAQSDLATIILIDSLDECEERQAVTSFLSSLVGVLPEIPGIKVLLTSRSERHISEGLRFHRDTTNAAMKTLDLDEVPSATVEHDIKLYIGAELHRLANVFGLRKLKISGDWLSEDTTKALAHRAGRLFIWASSAIAAVEHALDPDKLLKELVSLPDNDSQTSSNMVVRVDKLYARILDDAFPVADADKERDVRSILGLLAVTREPLPPLAIARILSITENTVFTLLDLLRSVIIVQSDPSLPIMFHHKSFLDFLTEAGRCENTRFFIDTSSYHFHIVKLCFTLLNDPEKLKRIQLKRYSRNEVTVDEELMYFSRYWADHLIAANPQDVKLSKAMDWLEIFMAKQHFRWLEVLGALRELHKAVDSLRSVREWLQIKDHESGGNGSSELTNWMADGERLILVTGDVIQESVPHIYHSALPWVPLDVSYRRLILGNMHSTEAKVLIGATTHWTGNIRTIRMPEQVHTLEYSHQGTLLAAGGSNGFAKLIHASTSGKEYLLNIDDSDPDHPATVNSDSGLPATVNTLTFRSDDGVLATAPGSRIQLWDVNRVIKHHETPPVVLIGHSEDIRKITFHPHDIYRLLSMDKLGNICLWDTDPRSINMAGSPKPSSSFFIGNASRWGAVCWIPNPDGPKTIAIGTKEGHINLYDVAHDTTGGADDPKLLVRATLQCLKYAGRPIDAVAVCNNGAYIAGGSDYNIVVYNTMSQAAVYSVATTDTSATSDSIAWMYSLMFSPKQFKDNTDDFLVFTGGKEVGLYYPQRNSDNIIPFSGHGACVLSVTLSPDGQLIATSALDGTIRLWAMNEQALAPGSNDHHKSRVKCTHFSLDGNFVVSGSLDKTVRVWSVIDGTLCGVLEGHRSYVLDAIILFDNRFVVSRDDSDSSNLDETLIVWKRDEEDKPIICRDTTIYREHGHFKSNFPFTAVYGPLGFFSTHTKWDSETERDLWTICCWELVLDSTKNDYALRLLAQGPLHLASGNDVVVRIFQSQSNAQQPISAFTIVVECASGARYHADWTAVSVAAEPEVDGLTFEAVDSPTGKYIASDPLVGHEEHCLQSDDNAWVLNKDTKILWVPPAHRGAGRWWKGKAGGKEKVLLVLEGESGRLSLIDFTGVSLND